MTLNLSNGFGLLTVLAWIGVIFYAPKFELLDWFMLAGTTSCYLLGFYLWCNPPRILGDNSVPTMLFGSIFMMLLVCSKGNWRIDKIGIPLWLVTFVGGIVFGWPIRKKKLAENR